MLSEDPPWSAYLINTDLHTAFLFNKSKCGSCSLCCPRTLLGQLPFFTPTYMLLLFFSPTSLCVEAVRSTVVQRPSLDSFLNSHQLPCCISLSFQQVPGVWKLVATLSPKALVLMSPFPFGSRVHMKLFTLGSWIHIFPFSFGSWIHVSPCLSAINH